MKIIGYVGTILMIIFSFTLIVWFAIAGLILLTIQARALKAYNLIALNLISVVGYSIQLMKG